MEGLVGHLHLVDAGRRRRALVFRQDHRGAAERELGRFAIGERSDLDDPGADRRAGRRCGRFGCRGAAGGDALAGERAGAGLEARGAAGGVAAVKPASGWAFAVASRGVLSGMIRLGSKLAEV